MVGVTAEGERDLPLESALKFATQLENSWVLGGLLVVKAMSGTNLKDKLFGGALRGGGRSGHERRERGERARGEKTT